MKKIIITSGEPAGIGPDIVLQLLTENTWDAQLIVVGDSTLLESRAKQLDIDVTLQEYNAEKAYSDTSTTENKVITVLPSPCSAPVIAGKLDSSNAQ